MANKEPIATIDEFIELHESAFDAEKGIAKVTVIKPGFNTSKSRFYPAEVLKRDAEVFENAPMHLDHMTEDEEIKRPVGSIKNVAGFLRNVKATEDGALVGEAHIVDNWLTERLKTMQSKELINRMGVSIRAMCGGVREAVDGVNTIAIRRIAKCKSVDFVSRAGAGGAVMVYEAEEDTEENSNDVKETQEDINAMENIEKELADLKAKLEAQEADKADLQAKLEATEKQAAIDKTAAAVNEALKDANLGDKAMAHIRKRFDGQESAEGVEQAIAEMQDLASEAREAKQEAKESEVKVKGNGPAEVPSHESEKKSEDEAHAERMNKYLEEHKDADMKDAFFATAEEA